MKAIIINEELNRIIPAEQLIDVLCFLIQEDIYKPWADKILIVPEEELPETFRPVHPKPFR